LKDLNNLNGNAFQTDREYKSHNCSVVHYSRRNPVTKDVHSRLSWVRSVCPWDTTKTSCKWKNFKNSGLSNEALQKIVNTIPRYCDDPSRISTLIKRNNAEDDPNLSSSSSSFDLSPSSDVSKNEDGEKERMKNIQSSIVKF